MPTYDEQVLRPGVVKHRKKNRRIKTRLNPKPEPKENLGDHEEIVIDLRIRLDKGNKFTFGNIQED